MCQLSHLSASFFHQGARHLYMNCLRPFLLKHQRRLDQIVGLIYGELVSIVLFSDGVAGYGYAWLGTLTLT